MRSFYKILNVHTDASSDEIKSAYRKLVMECHPDHTKDNKKIEQFYLVQEAYDTLMDADLREEYDFKFRKYCEKEHRYQKQVYQCRKEDTEERNFFTLLMLSFLVVLVSFSYIVLSKEKPLFPEVYPISTWSFGFMGMCYITGLTLGATCYVLKKIPTLSTLEHSLMANRKWPMWIVFLVSSIFFWLGYVYLLLLARRNKVILSGLLQAFHFLLMSIFILTFASWLSFKISYVETLLWSGNILVLGLLSGWIGAEAYKVTVIKSSSAR